MSIGATDRCELGHVTRLAQALLVSMEFQGRLFDSVGAQEGEIRKKQRIRIKAGITSQQTRPQAQDALFSVWHLRNVKYPETADWRVLFRYHCATCNITGRDPQVKLFTEPQGGKASPMDFCLLCSHESHTESFRLPNSDSFNLQLYDLFAGERGEKPSRPKASSAIWGECAWIDKGQGHTQKHQSQCHCMGQIHFTPSCIESKSLKGDFKGVQMNVCMHLFSPCS